MAIEDYGELLESSEEIVLKVRLKQEALEELPPNDPDAAHIGLEIRQLIGVLVARHRKKIVSYAKRLTESVPSLYEDAISEITFEVISAVRSPKRAGPATAFEATLRGLALDAYDRLKAQNKGTPGLKVKVGHGGPGKEFGFESADASLPAEDGSASKTHADRAEDDSAFQAFEQLTGSVAYRQAAALFTERQRAIMDLHLQGHSNKKIAAKLDIDRDTVASHLAKAISILKRHLTPQRVEHS